MLEGLMGNDFPLTTGHILERMRTVNAGSEVVTLHDGGATTRATYGELVPRIGRLAGALTKLGIEPGDRVATFAWNTQQHLECYLAIPTMGAVLHTLNLRLFPEQVEYIVNHAQDKVIILDDSLVKLLEPLVETFKTVEHFIVIGDGDTGSLPNVLRYEELLAEADEDFAWPDVDERAAAGLCYTSGTTGNPKGVLYSHRSTVLHALTGMAHDTLRSSKEDRVLPVVPMFHAMAWGLPYACGLSGASLIMPNRFLQAEPLVKLMVEEQVNCAGAVPTIWMDVLRYADEHKPDLSLLKNVVCGGTAVPLALMKGFQERHDVVITQAWGMTETSPLGSVARPPATMAEEEQWSYRTLAGRLCPLVEARLIDDDGSEVPWDGESTGELEVRGPWVATAYYEDPEGDDKFRDGWLRTGDVAAILEGGWIKITDRAKDVIKSGGEWISSYDLENELMGHEGVAEAAVIAKPDERWSERPLACVVLKDDSVTAEQLRDFLVERVAKWWVPDEFAFIPEVPKTSVGKFDKKVLRAQLADDELPNRVQLEVTATK
jgi:fatty-acyl-CoA synthase